MKFIELREGLLINASLIRKVYVKAVNIRVMGIGVKPEYIYDVLADVDGNDGRDTIIVSSSGTEEEALKKYNEIKEKLFTND